MITRKPPRRTLMEALADPRSNLGEVAELLECDPILGEKVIRWANAPEFRRRVLWVEDLRTAVRLLGLRRITWMCREIL